MAPDDGEDDSLLIALARAPEAAPPSTFTGTSRYRAVRLLGEGGFGVVYEVEDRALGARLALKLLRYARPDGLYRFKREFRALQQLQHENLARLYELGAEGERWFFTMELVEGRPLYDYVAGSPERLRRALVQVARALAYVHAAGWLHRDLKPSNVLIDRSGRAVLLDFGLAVGLDARDLTTQVAGTPRYMSPEQAADRPLGPASDWYALGVLLYEGLTGRPPFTGNFAALQKLKEAGAPPSPRTLVPDAPEELCALASALLASDPSARPSGAEVVARLDGGSALPAAEAESFVGRAHELEALAAALDEARLGRGTLVLLHGPSGIGKSALLAELARAAARRDAYTLVLAGRCYDRESVPYKALDAVVDELARALAALPELEVEGLMPRHVAALAQTFPVLRRVGAVARHAGFGDGEALRGRAAGALRELLARLADRRPIVVCVDDVQWGDADSAVLLAEVLRPPDAPPLLFVAAYRSEDAARSDFLRELRARCAPELNLRELALEPLAPDEAAALAARRLAEVNADPTRAAAIAAESRGSPFLVGALARHGGGARTGDLAEMIARRAAALPEATRRLLSVIAIGGGPLPIAAAATAATTPPDDVHAALARLETERLTRSAPASGAPGVECYHDRIREAVARALGEDERRGLHLALAEALEAGGGADPELLAAHLRRAGAPARAAPWTERAAARAVEAHAHDHAARLFRLLLDDRAAAGLTGEADHAIRLRLAEALGYAGRVVEAASAYEAAARASAGPAARELRVRAATELMMGGYLQRSHDILAETLAGLGVELPRTPAGLVVMLLAGRARLRLRGLGYVERTDVPASERARRTLVWQVVGAFATVQPLVTAALMPRFLRESLDAGDAENILRGLCGLAMQVTFDRALDGAASARACLAEASSLARKLERGAPLALIRMAEGVAAMNQERYGDAIGPLAEAVAIGRSVGGATDPAVHRARMIYFATLVQMGRASALLAELPPAIADLHERGNLAAWVYASTFWSWALLARGRLDESRRALDEAVARSPDGFELPLRSGRMTAVQQLLYEHAGGGAAWDRYQSVWAEVKRGRRALSQAIWSRAVHVRAAAAIARAADEPARADQLLAIAAAEARRLARTPTSAAPAIGRAVAAAVAAARGDRAGAARLLAEATPALDSCGYEAMAACARRRHGQLLGGDRGRALTAEGDAWMRGQDVVDPERWTNLYLPGRW